MSDARHEIETSHVSLEALVCQAHDAYDKYLDGFAYDETNMLTQTEFVWRWLAAHKYELQAALMHLDWQQ